MPDLVASKEEMENLTEEGMEKKKGLGEGGDDGSYGSYDGSYDDWEGIDGDDSDEEDTAYADLMWEDVKGVRMKMPTVKTFFLGLATFMLQVAPAWVDVGSDWMAGHM